MCWITAREWGALQEANAEWRAAEAAERDAEDWPDGVESCGCPTRMLQDPPCSGRNDIRHRLTVTGRAQLDPFPPPDDAELGVMWL